MRQLKIAYPMRVDALESPGGDLLQVQQHIAGGAAASPGFNGDVIVDPNADFASYDVVHLTNVNRPAELYHYFKRAKQAGKPVIVSPIHHSYREIERFEREARNGFVGIVSGLLSFSSLEALRCILRCWRYPRLVCPFLKLMSKGIQKAQTLVLGQANCILILTEKECIDLAHDICRLDARKVIALPNGFDAPLVSSHTISTNERDLDVCIVGRIESRKNQIAILSALNDLKISGTFIGRENRNHAGYCKEFKRLLAESKSRYLGGLPHTETFAVMRRAKVHVSASWFEVSSLVDIEAFCAGCRIVSSRNGGTFELLRGNAHYIDPGSPAALRTAIAAALYSGSPAGTRFESKECPALETWETVTDRLLKIYEAVLGSGALTGLLAA